MNAKSFARSFVILSAPQQAKLLAAWMQALTIDARDTYIPGTQAVADPVRLRGFNELQHRIAGQLAALLIRFSLESRAFSGVATQRLPIPSISHPR